MTSIPSPQQTKGGAKRKLVCTIHSVLFVRPEPYFDGNSWRVPAARCPICVEKQRQKVAALLGSAPRKRTPSRQRPVVMIKEFEK
jgi:hypothetical protein